MRSDCVLYLCFPTVLRHSSCWKKNNKTCSARKSKCLLLVNEGITAIYFDNFIQFKTHLHAIRILSMLHTRPLNAAIHNCKPLGRDPPEGFFFSGLFVCFFAFSMQHIVTLQYAASYNNASYIILTCTSHHTPE